MKSVLIDRRVINVMTGGKEKDVIIFIHVWMVSYVNVGNANDKRQRC